MTGLSDAACGALVRRIRDGDVSAFETLFRALHLELCGVAESFVKSPPLAEEIVQDVFLGVWMQRERWKPASARAYLFASVRNRAIEQLRRHGASTRAELLSPEDLHRSTSGAPALAPDRALERNETSIAVRAAVDALTPRAREAFTLQQDHELSQADIAATMGISVKGVEKLLATARARLQLLLARFAPGAGRP
jgi:RNA polymerase sigma-70 factor (ECF subfamily)